MGGGYIDMHMMNKIIIFMSHTSNDLKIIQNYSILTMKLKKMMQNVFKF